MGRSQRNKGAGYEREVVEAFTATFRTHYPRHIGQARDGGEDAVIGPLVLEMKRRKSLKGISDWLRQCIAGTAAYVKQGPAKWPASDYVPVVVMREDNGESMVLLQLSDFLEVLDDTLVCKEMIVGDSPEPRRDVDNLL